MRDRPECVPSGLRNTGQHKRELYGLGSLGFRVYGLGLTLLGCGGEAAQRGTRREATHLMLDVELTSLS